MKNLMKVLAVVCCIGGWAASVSAQENIYSFEMTDIDGQKVPLSNYQGKALLIVNTASKCGRTPQYASLEKLYETYKNKGFEVLAFPANNFKNQEPGTNEDIKKFCSLNYNVTFPLFSKIDVIGKNMDPLYAYLTQETKFPGDIEWNFAKFLVSPSGEVVGRFNSKLDPLTAEVTAAIESVLPKS